MKRIRLGHSQLEISRIGLGSAAIGGSWEWGWGAQDDQASIRTIHAALDAGVNWIDTAPVYGCGHSEAVIGRALKETTNKPFIFTKCGSRWNEKRDIVSILTPVSIREEVEHSLMRLGVETIDLYQIHWPNPTEEIEEAFATMADLVKEGKVSYLGVSNFSVDQMDRIRKIAPLTSLQPPYNAVNREAEVTVLPYCLENGIGSIVYSPMGSGLLTGKMTRERILNLGKDDWRSDSVQFQEPALTKNLRIAEEMSRIARDKGCHTTEVAIAWALHNPSVSAAIVGMRSEKQLQGVIRGGEIGLTDEDMTRIDLQLEGDD